MDSETGGSFELAISIAGMPLQLRFHDLNPAAAARIANWYAAFIVDPVEGMPEVEVTVEPGEAFLAQDGPVWQVRTGWSGGRIDFQSHFEQGWFDLDRGRGELTLRPIGNPENYLRAVYAFRCLERGGLVLHASGVIWHGKGYVFFGASSSGKTTITRYSAGYGILSDDLVILMTEPIDGQPGVRVYGVPFRGELPEAPRLNASAPLHGLFSLAKDTRHFTVPLDAHVAVGRLAACVPFVMTGPGSATQVLKVCADIARRVPVRVLHFRPDSGFWSVIDA